MFVPRRFSHCLIQTGHGFQIVVEHVRPRPCHRLDRAVLALEIRRQNLDRRGRRRFANAFDAANKLPGAAVIQIVAIHRRDDHMPQAEVADGFGQIVRLVRVEQVRSAGCDIAKRAFTRADAAQDHHRGVTLRPAFTDIGTRRLFAHGIELKTTHQFARVVITREKSAL